MLAPWKKSYDKPRQCIKKQRHHFADKGPYSQTCGFSSSHAHMWELDHKEGWALKNWCLWTVVLEKILESPLGGKEIKPVNPKGNQPWIFIGRTDAEAEAPVLWPPEELIHWKGPWCWERLRAGEEGGDRGWHHHSMDMSLSRLWEIVKDRHAVVHGLQSWKQLSDWRKTTVLPKAHLTSHSRMSDSRWMTTPLWLSRPLRPFFL